MCTYFDLKLMSNAAATYFYCVCFLAAMHAWVSDKFDWKWLVIWRTSEKKYKRYTICILKKSTYYKIYIKVTKSNSIVLLLSRDLYV